MTRMGALLAVLVMALSTPAVAAAEPAYRTPERQRAVDYVLARALAQRGVPFVYGGGGAAGPSAPATRSTTSEEQPEVVTTLSPAVPVAPVAPVSPVVGFDASGLMVYAYAGVGLALPRSSGAQYLVGRRVLPSQAVPGDLIFYGPDGSRSVAMFLGNNVMLEATDPVVTVSAVRFTDMTPYLVRIID